VTRSHDQIAFTDFDHESSDPTDPVVLEEDFQSVLHEISCMSDENGYDFPPIPRVIDLVRRIANYLKAFETVEHMPVICHFLTSIPSVPEFTQNPCILEILAFACVNISLRDFTEETRVIVFCGIQLWEFGNPRVNMHLVYLFVNAVVDNVTRNIIFDEGVPERVFTVLETTENAGLIVAILDFYCTVVFHVLENSEICPDPERIAMLFNRLWKKAVAIFEATNATREAEPPELGCAFDLLSKLVGYAPILDAAMRGDFVKLMIRKSRQLSSKRTLEAFFLIVEQFLCDDKYESVFTAELFGAMADIANRVCSQSRVDIDPFGVFVQLNRKHWRRFSGSDLISKLLSVSDELSFLVARSFCLWIMDLMQEADVEVRREIARPALFDLVVRILQSDQPKVVDAIGWWLLKMKYDDAVFWKNAFEEVGLQQALESLHNDLSDPESLDQLEDIQRQLFPEAGMWEREPRPAVA
jgi:hypothetical protein